MTDQVLISQKYKYDCGVACLAMYTGESYNTIKTEYFDDNDFNKFVMSNVEILTAMLNLGYSCVVEDTEITPQRWAELKDTPMMVVVPSRNQKNGLHMVYWNGEQVFDPTNETKKYSTRRFLKRVQNDEVFSAFYCTEEEEEQEPSPTLVDSQEPMFKRRKE